MAISEGDDNMPFDGANAFTSTTPGKFLGGEKEDFDEGGNEDQTDHMDIDQPDDGTHIRWGASILGSIAAGHRKVSDAELEKVKEEVAAVKKSRQEMTNEALAAFGIQPAPEALVASQRELEKPAEKAKIIIGTYLEIPKEKIDFFAAMAKYPELTIEMAAHIKPADLLSIYAISKDFHEVVNGHLTHTMKLCARTQAFESSVLFPPNVYHRFCTPDPVGRLDLKKGKVRLVPGLRWLQFVYHREKTVRDILACMARQGHRMPPSMSISLKKMWVLMDCATNEDRLKFMAKGNYVKADDLYNIQMFVIKLDMRFNNPIDGPGTDGMRKLMLGQRHLTPLCNFLKRKLGPMDVIKMIIRYDYVTDEMRLPFRLWDIEPTEIGIGHVEGWGRGLEHLLRPDQLVIKESVRRQLNMKSHLMSMMLWGYVDPITAQNTPPTPDEMYMSDDGESVSDLERMRRRP